MCESWYLLLACLICREQVLSWSRLDRNMVLCWYLNCSCNAYIRLRYFTTKKIIWRLLIICTLIWSAYCYFSCPCTGTDYWLEPMLYLQYLQNHLPEKVSIMLSPTYLVQQQWHQTNYRMLQLCHNHAWEPLSSHNQPYFFLVFLFFFCMYKISDNSD